MSKTKISVSQLREGLSYYMAQARKGEPLIITSHGKPVARVEGIAEGAPGGDLAELDWIKWGTGKLQGISDGPKLSGSPASDAVLEDRR